MISDWLGYILLGLIGGLSEILPVSATGNTSLLRQLFGLQDDGRLIGFFIRIGCIGAIFVQCGSRMVHIYRQLENARLPVRRRRRMLDANALRDGRVLMGALLPMIVISVVCSIYEHHFQGLMPMAGLLVLTGILVYIPQHLPGGNRSSRGMARVDGLLLGIAAGLGGLPGMSSMGAMLFAGLLRGCDREYILELSLMLCVPTLAVGGILELLGLIMAGFAGTTFILVLFGILAAGLAFAAAYMAISVLRYLAVRAGFSGFAFISWGLAMFSFILYLMT